MTYTDIDARNVYRKGRQPFTSVPCIRRFSVAESVRLLQMGIRMDSTRRSARISESVCNAVERLARLLYDRTHPDHAEVCETWRAMRGLPPFYTLKRDTMARLRSLLSE